MASVQEISAVTEHRGFKNIYLQSNITPCSTPPTPSHLQPQPSFENKTFHIPTCLRNTFNHRETRIFAVVLYREMIRHRWAYAHCRVVCGVCSYCSKAFCSFIYLCRTDCLGGTTRCIHPGPQRCCGKSKVDIAELYGGISLYSEAI